MQLLSIDMHLGRYILYLSRVLNFRCGVIKFYMIFEATAAAAAGKKDFLIQMTSIM